MKKYDVIILGGGPAGIITSVMVKTYYPEKSVLVIRKEKIVMIPCGIPYIFGTVDIDKNIIPDGAITKKGSELFIDEIINVDLENKKVKTKKEEFEFEKLVFATGSTPIEPKWLKGRDKENVFYVKKDEEYLKQMKYKIKDLKKIAIIGGGFIGVEVADEIKKMGKDVVIIEKLPRILNLAMDNNVGQKAEDKMKERGVEIKTNSTVSEIIGKDKVEGVLLENGEKIDCDGVIVSIGYKPNIELAKNAGIEIGESGAIVVDEYMRTSAEHVFAVGDCVERRSFITRRVTGVMLASTATSEARIAGANLYKLKVLRKFGGTIGIFSTKIGECGFGSAGISEVEAQKENIDIEIGEFETMDRHPGSIPGAMKQNVKLIAAKKSGILLGAQVCGGESVGEMINLLGLMIQKGMSVYDILTLQIGTHPLLTAAPTVYPIIKAAENLVSKIM